MSTEKQKNSKTQTARTKIKTKTKKGTIELNTPIMALLEFFCLELLYVNGFDVA